MHDVILTGASRGIGRALALELATRPDVRLVLVARDAARLEGLAREIAARRSATDRGRGAAVVVAGDVGAREPARALGERLCEVVEGGATLIHNAGLWPSRRVMTAGGLEQAFVVNFVGPMLLQRPLIAAGRLARILVVSAGLAVKGRFDPERTPAGADFSAFRTYCTTKLCLAVAMRDVAAAHPELDVTVLHPGVVRTDLGDRPGLLGSLLRLVKRRWESPEACAARLARILDRPRWSAAGQATWMFEESEQPWPAAFDDAATRRAVRTACERWAGL